MWGCLLFIMQGEVEYIAREVHYIYIHCFNRKEVATTDTEKDAEAAKNVKAASVGLSEATIKNMKVKYFKGGT